MIQENQIAPDFALPNENGKIISLNDFKGKFVVLYFYPKDMTPGCTQEACDFRDQWNLFQKLKVPILGISADPIERHQIFHHKYELPFHLLADPEKKVLKDYGVWQKKILYGRSFMGIVRTTVIIDPSRKIKKIFSKVKVKGHVHDVLNSL
jgi:peroxiredoxin Q/BCP